MAPTCKPPPRTTPFNSSRFLSIVIIQNARHVTLFVISHNNNNWPQTKLALQLSAHKQFKPDVHSFLRRKMLQWRQITDLMCWQYNTTAVLFLGCGRESLPAPMFFRFCLSVYTNTTSWPNFVQCISTNSTYTFRIMNHLCITTLTILKKKETKKNSLSHLQLVLHPLFTIQFILTRSSLSISLTWMKKNETKKLHSTQSTRNKVKQNEKTIAIGFIDMDKVGGCFLRHNHSFFWKKKVSMKLKHSNEDTEAVWMCQIIRFSLPVCLLSILF